MLIKGKTWRFGRNVNTDLIFPKMWFRPSYEPGEMASHLMAGIDDAFASKVKRGDIIVGGQNFGCGSSREEAAAAMKEAGVGAVVAPSFGRSGEKTPRRKGSRMCRIPDRSRSPGTARRRVRVSASRRDAR